MAKLVTKRYATALFDMATEENAVERYASEIEVVLEAIEDAPEFVAVLQNQKVTLQDKIDVVENIFGEKLSTSIVGLMVLVVKKGRQDFLVPIFETFLEMVRTQKGILKATVTSAVPLSKPQLEAIQKQLVTNTKSEIEIETIVDETIIGGLIIRVGDKVVDASVAGKMQALKKQLSELKLA